MKTKYEAYGRLFDDDKKALAYEKEVEEREERKKMLIEEKDRRWKEVENAFEKAEKLLSDYKKDYAMNDIPLSFSFPFPFII